MNQIKDPNNPEGDLPDLGLPSEEREVRTPGDRPRVSSLIPKIAIILVIVAIGFVAFKFFFSGGEAPEEQTQATKFTPPVPGTPTTGFKANPPATLDKTPPMGVNEDVVGEPVSSTTTAVEDLGPQNRILLLEKKLEQFMQEEKGKIDELKTYLSQVGSNSNSASIKQLSADVEALRQKVENWGSQFQAKLGEQAGATAQAIERVNSLEQHIEQQKKQQEQERDIKFNLPFKMLSVDLWNGKPYVAVSLDEKVSLITVGDVAMGWKVVSIDFDGGKATFVKNGKRIEQTTER